MQLGRHTFSSSGENRGVTSVSGAFSSGRVSFSLAIVCVKVPGGLSLLILIPIFFATNAPLFSDAFAQMVS